MRLMSALFSALIVLGLAGAASAMCSGSERSTDTAETKPPVVVPPAVGS